MKITYRCFFFSILLILVYSCKKDLLKQVSVTEGTFTDLRDGKVYKTTTIGEYTWFAENLSYETVSGSCYYNDDTVNKEYGRLYTYSAALDAVPAGWHLPTYNELIYLIDNLGGQSQINDHVKEAGNLHWSNNQNTDNYSRLTLIPGGCFNGDENSFKAIGQSVYMWYIRNTGAVAIQNGWGIDNNYFNTVVYFPLDNINLNNKISVRCVKNKE